MRKSGLTLAPEAGTQRLRDVINKTTTAEDLLRAVDLAFREGWKLVKLYFMIGQPTETDEDLKGMADLISQVVALARRRNGAKINVSISPFVPKAGTPFQWVEQDAPAETRRKLSFLRERIRDRLVKVSWRDAEVAQIEGVLARGDRRLAPVVLAAWKAGARLEGWSEHFHEEIWLRALAENGLAPEQFTKGYGLDAPLPWDHIDKGVTTRFLQDEYRRALGEEITPDCRDGKCNRCGLMAQPVCQEILKEAKGAKLAPALEGSALPGPLQEEGQSGAGAIKSSLALAAGLAGEKSAAAADREDLATVDAQPELNSPAMAREGRWVRLHYHRGEEVRWISHLDFIHVFERALRRAEWPLVYSEGYNPHPRMSFAPPLPTGHVSQAEYIDLMAAGEEIGRHVAALAGQLPAGIVLKEALILPAKPQALADVIARAECRVTWPTLAEPTDLDARIASFMEQGEAWVTRQKGNEPVRRIDVRPYIVSLVWREGALEIISHIDHGKTVRMEEIVSLLLPDEPGRARLATIERRKLWMEREGAVVSPLEGVEAGTRV